MRNLSPEANSARVASYYFEDILAGNGNNAKKILLRRLIGEVIDTDEATFLRKDAAKRLKLVPKMTAELSAELAQIVLNEKYRLRIAQLLGPLSVGGGKAS